MSQENVKEFENIENFSLGGSYNNYELSLVNSKMSFKYCVEYENFFCFAQFIHQKIVQSQISNEFCVLKASFVVLVEIRKFSIEEIARKLFGKEQSYVKYGFFVI